MSPVFGPQAEFLGSATLGSAATDIGPVVFGPGWGWLFVNVYIAGYSASQIAQVRLGTGATVDTATNYSFWAQNFTAAATAGGGVASNAGVRVAQAAQTNARRGNVLIHNPQGANKTVTVEGVDYSAQGPLTAASAMAGGHVVMGEWFNTTQAQSIGVNSGGAGTLNANSAIVVYGIPGTS
jgi:hypothetical protein